MDTADRSFIRLVVIFDDFTGSLQDALLDMSYHIVHPAASKWTLQDIQGKTASFNLFLKKDAEIDTAKLQDDLDIGFQRLEGDGEYRISLDASLWRQVTSQEAMCLAA